MDHPGCANEGERGARSSTRSPCDGGPRGCTCSVAAAHSCFRAWAEGRSGARRCRSDSRAWGSRRFPSAFGRAFVAGRPTKRIIPARWRRPRWRTWSATRSRPRTGGPPRPSVVVGSWMTSPSIWRAGEQAPRPDPTRDGSEAASGLSGGISGKLRALESPRIGDRRSPRATSRVDAVSREVAPPPTVTWLLSTSPSVWPWTRRSRRLPATAE